jgi:hypothetical protein
MGCFARRLRVAGLLDDDTDTQIQEVVRAEVVAETEDAIAHPLPTGDDEIDEVYA